LLDPLTSALEAVGVLLVVAANKNADFFA